MPSRTLLLVDGTALAYRAFYAIASLTTSSGAPSNAVFGFIKLLRQLEATWKPTHRLVTFDGGSPEERLALLPSYKAQREEMPSALEQQFELINEFLACAAVPFELIKGQEADDIMATYAAWAERDGADVLLATSDKDMFQLVNDRVNIVSLTKSGERMGAEQVKAKTGVTPGQTIMWQALMGDAADNIPGVPGVGEKTAARLLNQFGTLEELWRRLPEVASEKQRASLLAAQADVVRNARMMALRKDLPRKLDWTDLDFRPPDYARLSAFLEKMEFHTMRRALQEESSRLF